MERKSRLALLLALLIIMSPFSLVMVAESEKYEIKYDEVVYLDIHENTNLMQEEYVVGIGEPIVSEPIPIEDLLDSECIEIEAYQKFREKYMISREWVDNADRLINPEYKVEIGELDYTIDEGMDVRFLSEDELLCEEYDYLFENNQAIGIAQLSQKDRISSSMTRTSSNPSCDVYVKGLYNSSGQQPPFKINEAYEFSLELGNNGQIAAANVVAKIYMDNVLMGVLNVGSIPASARYDMQVYVTLGYGANGGWHLLRIEASTTTPDANPNNNAVSASYQWVQNVDLAVLSLINSTSGNTAFETTATQDFKVVVANFGPDTAYSPYIDLDIFENSINRYSDRFYYHSLPYLTGVQVSWPLYISRSGNYRFEASAYDLYVDDVYMDDNMLPAYFTCIPDGCGASSHTLRTYDNNNLILSVNDQRISVTDVQDARNQWNGISSYINIGTVSQNNPNAVCDIKVDHLNNDEVGRFTYSYNAFGVYQGGTISIAEGCYDANGNYVYDGNSGNSSYRTHWLMYTLIHEIGHLISLDEVEYANSLCNDYSVMFTDGPLHVQDVNSPKTHYVTPHDIKSLISKWGG